MKFHTCFQHLLKQKDKRAQIRLRVSSLYCTRICLRNVHWEWKEFLENFVRNSSKSSHIQRVNVTLQLQGPESMNQKAKFARIFARKRLLWIWCCIRSVVAFNWTLEKCCIDNMQINSKANKLLGYAASISILPHWLHQHQVKRIMRMRKNRFGNFNTSYV